MPSPKLSGIYFKDAGLLTGTWEHELPRNQNTKAIRNWSLSFYVSPRDFKVTASLLLSAPHSHSLSLSQPGFPYFSSAHKPTQACAMWPNSQHHLASFASGANSCHLSASQFQVPEGRIGFVPLILWFCVTCVLVDECPWFTRRLGVMYLWDTPATLCLLGGNQTFVVTHCLAESQALGVCWIMA